MVISSSSNSGAASAASSGRANAAAAAPAAVNPRKSRRCIMSGNLYHSAMRAIRMLRERAPLVEQIVDDPQPARGEVVVDIRCAGICHSDAHYRADASRVRLPVTLGHEIAGVVIGTGERVALHYVMPNGDMLGKERDGGFAERIAVPRENL